MKEAVLLTVQYHNLIFSTNKLYSLLYVRFLLHQRNVQSYLSLFKKKCCVCMEYMYGEI